LDFHIDLFCSEQIVADSKDNIKVIIGLLKLFCVGFKPHRHLDVIRLERTNSSGSSSESSSDSSSDGSCGSSSDGSSDESADD